MLAGRFCRQTNLWSVNSSLWAGQLSDFMAWTICGLVKSPMRIYLEISFGKILHCRQIVWITSVFICHSLNSTSLVSHVSTRHNMFKLSSASRRACRTVLFNKLDTAKMHGLDMISRSHSVDRVETSVLSQLSLLC